MKNFSKLKTISTIQETQKAVKKKMFSYIAAGLGLVAGLAWNDAIKAVIDYFVPDKGNSILAKIFYAFVITTVVAISLFYIEKSFEEEEKKKKPKNR